MLGGVREKVSVSEKENIADRKEKREKEKRNDKDTLLLIIMLIREKHF